MRVRRHLTGGGWITFSIQATDKWGEMYLYHIEKTVIFAILFIALLVFLFLSAVSIRRIKRSIYYRRLDRARERYRPVLLPVITNALPIPEECIGKKGFSIEWQAMEDILFEALERRLAPVLSITAVFDRLGYIDIYIKRLRSGNRFHRAMAAEKLGRFIAFRAATDLIQALHDPSREVRIVAVRALGEIRPPQALLPLTEILIRGSDDPEYVSLRIVKTAIKKFQGEAIPYLLPLLEYSSWRVRGQAADLIGEIGSMASPEALIEKLDDPEPDVRAKVARALGKIRAREAVQPLIRSLKDASWVVRLQSAKTLGLIGGGEAVSPLLELLLDSHWQVRSTAANSLRKMGNFVIPALLRTLLQTRDRYAREQIVEELQKTNILENQIRRLGSKDAKERKEASILLVAAGNNGALGLLTRSVKKSINPAVRIRLVHILSLIDHPRSTEILREVAEGDENEAVRYTAKMVLEKRKTVEVQEAGGIPF